MRIAGLISVIVATSLAAASCAPTRSRPEPAIALSMDSRGARLTITNLGEGTLHVVDHGYFDGSVVPSNIFLRVADGTGRVLPNQANDPDGWWTPRFVDSSVMERDRLTALAPSSAIERSLSLSELVAGMRLSVPQPVGTCRFQIRATVEYAGGSVTRTSSWTETECSILSASAR